MHALVIGVGSFGNTIASELASKGVEVTVVEQEPARAEDVRDISARVIVGDATDKDLLIKLTEDVDMAIVSLGERVDASILIVHFLKEIGVKKIIAKATSIDHGKILKIVGATQTVYPERDEAIRLVSSLVSPNVVDLFRLTDEFNMVELAVPDSFVNKTIGELDLRKKFSLNIIAVRNALDGRFNALPDRNYGFRPDDILIVIGDTKGLDQVRKKI